MVVLTSFLGKLVPDGGKGGLNQKSMTSQITCDKNVYVERSLSYTARPYSVGQCMYVVASCMLPQKTTKRYKFYFKLECHNTQ